MTKRPGSPLFLERRSYRFRRMMDAVRLLPLVALAFWMIPLMWPMPDTVLPYTVLPETGLPYTVLPETGHPEVVGAGGVPMSHAVRYIFGVWLAAIALAYVLWRRTARQIALENQG